MESVQTQKARLLKELAEKVAYWVDKNDDYANAYIMMMHGFTYPQEDNIKKENENQNPQ